ncbi:DeoR/GlpR family DNA-binding transcription regulator [Dactylosporangium sp. CA-139066]|uniref:DeoR/GlpR family DNA-binding transcription regulator n=1 Tax=Dactylosporangium sp. CA-139066 TaxID=3239930 RepID=UPI003D8D6278
MGVRHGRLLALLAERGELSVAELAAQLKVSAVTVRGDLRALVAARRVVRTLGGAALPADAAELVHSGDVVFLDDLVPVAAGLTAFAGVTVCTASLAVADVLRRAPGINLVLSGGTYDPATGLLLDPLAGPAFANLRADVAILGCHGYEPDGAVTGAHPGAAALWRRMAGAARCRALVVARGAEGRTGPVLLCASRDVDVVVRTH